MLPLTAMAIINPQNRPLKVRFSPKISRMYNALIIHHPRDFSTNILCAKK
jgi:hypothetical protein